MRTATARRPAHHSGAAMMPHRITTRVDAGHGVAVVELGPLAANRAHPHWRRATIADGSVTLPASRTADSGGRRNRATNARDSSPGAKRNRGSVAGAGTGRYSHASRALRVPAGPACGWLLTRGALRPWAGMRRAGAGGPARCTRPPPHVSQVAGDEVAGGYRPRVVWW